MARRALAAAAVNYQKPLIEKNPHGAKLTDNLPEQAAIALARISTTDGAPEHHRAVECLAGPARRSASIGCRRASHHQQPAAGGPRQL
jgi:hypothetical protein